MMTENEAAEMIGYLVTTTTGWNDDSVDMYIEEAKMLGDKPAAFAAARHVAHTWTERSRPPWAVVLDAYHQERRRTATTTREVEPSRRYPTVKEGIAIARAAYEKHYHRPWPGIKITDPTGGPVRSQETRTVVAGARVPKPTGIVAEDPAAVIAAEARLLGERLTD